MPWWPLGTGQPRPGRAWGPAVGGATHSPAGLMGVSGLGPALSSVWAATGDVVTGRSPDAQRAALASSLQVPGLSRRPAWWRRPEVTGRRRAALSGGGEARGGSTRRAQGLRFCRGEGSPASLSQEHTRGFHSPPQGPAAFCPLPSSPRLGCADSRGRGGAGVGAGAPGEQAQGEPHTGLASACRASGPCVQTGALWPPGPGRGQLASCRADRTAEGVTASPSLSLQDTRSLLSAAGLFHWGGLSSSLPRGRGDVGVLPPIL